jgi:hypothetical protein
VHFSCFRANKFRVARYPTRIRVNGDLLFGLDLLGTQLQENINKFGDCLSAFQPFRFLSTSHATAATPWSV